MTEEVLSFVSSHSQGDGADTPNSTTVSAKDFFMRKHIRNPPEM